LPNHVDKLNGLRIDGHDDRAETDGPIWPPLQQLNFPIFNARWKPEDMIYTQASYRYKDIPLNTIPADGRVAWRPATFKTCALVGNSGSLLYTK
jgi:hypothetical protein